MRGSIDGGLGGANCAQLNSVLCRRRSGVPVLQQGRTRSRGSDSRIAPDVPVGRYAAQVRAGWTEVQARVDPFLEGGVYERGWLLT